mmetsp:Transcript_2279/g.5214  ORF Transcript_2279/g.5214 Transcript_2279/m.5214 type:complete len:264 (+) Transcript_2279:189-980(+)
MGVNNEGIVNRRQLLVRVGSLMKLSWRKSKENVLEEDMKDDDSCDNKNNNSLDQRRGKGRKRNLFVMFDEDRVEIPSTYDEPLSGDEIKTRWYKTEDYNRFKKDTVISSFNFLNARRASKPFDETKYCTQGIEDMCIQDVAIRQRNNTEKKYIYKVIRDEQARQKKEKEQEQKQDPEQQNQLGMKFKTKTRYPFAFVSYPDEEKLRAVSLHHTKGARDRALARGIEYARAVQRNGGIARGPSMKNLFKAACRTHSGTLVSLFP